MQGLEGRLAGLYDDSPSDPSDSSRTEIPDDLFSVYRNMTKEVRLQKCLGSGGWEKKTDGVLEGLIQDSAHCEMSGIFLNAAMHFQSLIHRDSWFCFYPKSSAYISRHVLFHMQYTRLAFQISSLKSFVITSSAHTKKCI